ncbi:MAG TPA: hypothetical protein VEJ42_07535 [Streptosporangiaceae bacterium]|nr:hypothetical protein [Streptosporangiaceae bacterium]
MRQTWAARADAAGELVVKARRGDRADAKTAWTAAHLPELRARGYPVPTIVWHGLLDSEWHVTVQNRLPGHPLTSLRPPFLDAVLRLIELQADAGIPAGERDFIGYVANVLFEDWDDVWVDTARSSPAGEELCHRLRVAAAGVGAAAAAGGLRDQRPEPAERADRRRADHGRGRLG